MYFSFKNKETIIEEDKEDKVEINEIKESKNQPKQ